MSQCEIHILAKCNSCWMKYGEMSRRTLWFWGHCELLKLRQSPILILIISNICQFGTKEMWITLSLTNCSKAFAIGSVPPVLDSIPSRGKEISVKKLDRWIRDNNYLVLYQLHQPAITCNYLLHTTTYYIQLPTTYNYLLPITTYIPIFTNGKDENYPALA